MTRHECFKSDDIVDLKIHLKVCWVQYRRDNHISPSDEMTRIIVGDSNVTCADCDIII